MVGDGGGSAGFSIAGGYQPSMWALQTLCLWARAILAVFDFLPTSFFPLMWEMWVCWGYTERCGSFGIPKARMSLKMVLACYGSDLLARSCSSSNLLFSPKPISFLHMGMRGWYQEVLLLCAVPAAQMSYRTIPAYCCRGGISFSSTYSILVWVCFLLVFLHFSYMKIWWDGISAWLYVLCWDVAWASPNRGQCFQR